MSDPQPRQLLNKTQSPKAPTSKLASELAQIYSIANSKVALTGALVLGGMLALNQVQAGNAAEFEFSDSATLDSAVASANADIGPNATATVIRFSGNAAEISRDKGISFTKDVTLDGLRGDVINQVTLKASGSFSGSCLICSTSSVTLNNIILDANNKSGVGAVAVTSTSPTTNGTSGCGGSWITY